MLRGAVTSAKFSLYDSMHCRMEKRVFLGLLPLLLLLATPSVDSYRLDCAKFVFAPRCRGVSAKRAAQLALDLSRVGAGLDAGTEAGERNELLQGTDRLNRMLLPNGWPRSVGRHAQAGEDGDASSRRGFFVRQALVDQGAQGLGQGDQGLSFGDQGLDASAWPRRLTRNSDELDTTAEQARRRLELRRAA